MKNPHLIIHHVLKLLILMGFTGYIAYLAFTGEILLYIAPHLVKYTELAAAGLFLFAVFQLYFLIRSRTKELPAACACGHHDHDHHAHDDHNHVHSHEPSRSVAKNALMYGLFILPLLFGALLPNQAFAGSLVKSRGIQVGESAGGIPADLAQVAGNDDPELKERFKSDKYNRDYAKLGMLLYRQDVIEMKDEWFIEKLQALNAFAGNFEGKTIRIKGFIYREEGLGENQFIIGRMAMTHCIADISPYGIIAESPQAGSFADDAWVELTGTITTTTYHGQQVIKIVVSDTKPAAAPTIPYVYPDWDFAKKL
ncbi:TIGR03943 family putative permease subunit [Paenibacillus dokdonensis]|uniref:TIGR03943 family putative permease subunit n=1 Tax=Paenibacillus dokdonensis TaxID=2567944 RepID=UPI001457AD2A|nr:TIGR03943 family protein [Paenibacillus dokdonensis]